MWVGGGRFARHEAGGAPRGKEVKPEGVGKKRKEETERERKKGGGEGGEEGRLGKKA